jgi:hypothetical protein
MTRSNQDGGLEAALSSFSAETAIKQLLSKVDD